MGLGRALDLILTGRPVPAAEALAMGLVSRVVPAGEARGAAEALARELAALPQACLRSDRQSVLEGLSLTEDAALAVEFRHGLSARPPPGWRTRSAGSVLARGDDPPEPPAIADPQGTRLRRTPPRQPMPGGRPPLRLPGGYPGSPRPRRSLTAGNTASPPRLAGRRRRTGLPTGAPGGPRHPGLDRHNRKSYNYGK